MRQRSFILRSQNLSEFWKKRSGLRVIAQITRVKSRMRKQWLGVIFSKALPWLWKPWKCWIHQKAFSKTRRRMESRRKKTKRIIYRTWIPTTLSSRNIIETPSSENASRSSTTNTTQGSMIREPEWRCRESNGKRKEIHPIEAEAPALIKRFLLLRAPILRKKISRKQTGKATKKKRERLSLTKFNKEVLMKMHAMSCSAALAQLWSSKLARKFTLGG